MSEEARNVELLRKAYGSWSKTRGASCRSLAGNLRRPHRLRLAGQWPGRLAPI